MMKRTLCILMLLLMLPAAADARVPGIWSLADLQEAAAAQNSEIQSLRSQVRSSEIAVSKARSQRWPEITFQSGGSYLVNPMDELTLHTSDFGMVPGSEVTVMEAQEPFQYQVGVNLIQPIFTWGKLTGAVNVQETLLEISRLQLADALQQVRTRTAVLVYSLKYVDEMVSLAARQHELSRRLEKNAEDSYAQGFIVQEDVLEVQMKSQEIAVQVRELEGRRERLLNELKEVTGLEYLRSEHLVFPDDISLGEETFPSRDAVTAAALADGRISLEIMQLLEEVRELGVRISRGDAYWKPDLALQIEAGVQGSKFPFLESAWYDHGDYQLQVTIALETTLWDGGSQIQEVRSSQEELESARIDRERTRREIRQEVSDSYSEFQVLVSRTAYNELRRQYYDSRIGFVQRQYDSGVGSEADVLEQRIAALGHELSSRGDLLDAVRHYFTIRQLTGGMDE